MIAFNSDSTATLSDSAALNNLVKEPTNKNTRTILKLLAAVNILLQDRYSKEKLEETFAVIKSAKKRGLLGSHKASDCCFAEEVNIANNLLRTPKLEKMELSNIINNPKEVYVYVALVAIGLIPA